MSVQHSVKSKVTRGRNGSVYTRQSFADLGSSAAVSKALARLAERGTLERIGQGIYVKPRHHPLLGRVLPGADEVVSQLVRQRGGQVQPHGAELARRLGLSTQMPLRPVFEGSAGQRTLHLGKLEVSMRRAPRSLKALLGRPAGEALSALRFLGQAGVTREAITTLRRHLGDEEFAVLQAHAPQGWLREYLR